MIVLVIRHGESEADLLNVHEGRADFSLTEKGRRQAEALSLYLKEHFSVTKLFASPLKRARETAEYLARAYGIEIFIEPDLMEFNNGLLAGLPFEEAKIKYPKVENLPIDQAVYGQESKLEFRNRADEVLNKILSGTRLDETIAIVSHGGLINQLYRSFLQLPVEGDTVFATSDTGTHVWRIEKDRKYIIKANLTEHLKELD